MVTPEELRAKAVRAYPRVVAAWLQDESLAGFFPLRLKARLSPIKNDVPATIAAVNALRAKSKQVLGWGYTIQWKPRRSRDFGHNQFPAGITVDTLNDLLRLAGRPKEFAETCRVAKQVRGQFPELADWLASNIRTLHRLAEPLEGLIAVARFFINNPWPDCYARQIPAAVDTKFIERHEPVLREWLNRLLPGSAIQAGQKKFALRFGLRDGQPHTAFRILDVDLQDELRLPFDEFSVPLRWLATLPVRNATVFIVENQLNLLTMPPFKRGIAIRGEGSAVTRLGNLEWLHDNRVIYWGDVDVEGFGILSSLRKLFPAGDVQSIMMDRDTVRRHAAFVIPGESRATAEPARLTDEERAAFLQCAEHSQRLEQEKIWQAYVDELIGELSANAHAVQAARVERMEA